jgi:hypothetical protein
MRRRISPCIIVSLMPFIGGCSLIIGSWTKEISESMYEHASRTKIESILGPPILEESFHDPYPSTRASDGSFGLVSSKACYEYHGRADDLEQFQGLGMCVGMTLGLGEVIAFPESIKLSHRLEKSFHQYDVWYDDKGKCVAYRASNDLGYGK